MKYRVSVGVIGWIDDRGPWPVSPGDGFWASMGQGVSTMQPNGWFAKSILGLMATSNRAPPTNISFPLYRATKDYRAMAWADLEFDDGVLGAQGPVNAAYVGSEAKSRIVDFGYTPPVSMKKAGSMHLLDAGLNFKRGVAHDLPQVGYPGPAPYTPPLPPSPTEVHLEDQHFYQGEGSPVSEICRGKQHNNTMLGPLPPAERLIANGLLRFRAGPHTDAVGITDAGSPYHVPWVWAEFLLSSLGGGRVRLRGASSIFPTVAWYLNDKTLGIPHKQVSDTAYPGKGLEIKPQTMNLWPVLTAGAPGRGPEPGASAERSYAGRKVPITSLPWTVKGRHWIDAPGMARPVVGS